MMTKFDLKTQLDLNKDGKISTDDLISYIGTSVNRAIAVGVIAGLVVGFILGVIVF